MLFFRVCNYAAKLRIKSKTTKNNVISPACSLCPIQNSQFSPRPTCPTCPTCLTRPSSPKIHNSKFKIQNSQFPSHYLEHIIGLKTLISMMGKKK